MFSWIGKAITRLTLLVAAVAFAYTAWETQNLRVSLDRMVASNETNITEMMIAVAHTEGQLARIRETVELLGGAEPAQGSDTTALEGKITATLTAAQREVLQQELNKWTTQLQDQRERSLAALRKSLEQKLSGGAATDKARDQRWLELKALVEKNQKSVNDQLKQLGAGLSSNPSGAIEAQGATLTNLEERLAAVVKAASESQEALIRRNERNEQRWKELFLALQENMEATQQRYAELAARLDQQQGGARKPASTARPEPQVQESRAQQEARAEREKLEEFCREVPQSTLCRDL